MAVGVSLRITDQFPPGPRDPEGIHPLIWEDRADGFVFSAGKPVTCVAYIGDALPEGPLFLSPLEYEPVSLETVY